MILVCIIGFNVKADTFNTKDLIPVDTDATIDTELFTYENMVFDSNLDAKGYAHLRFGSITSKGTSKKPISINVLLYDENMKNIGYLTYCTEKDISSDNNLRKIAPGEKITFDIAVTKRYFPTDQDETNGVAKVKYISVYDENPYCTVGGYDKYYGLGHEEIVNGIVKNNTTSEGIMSQIIVFLETDGARVIILAVVFSLVFLFIQGLILNILHSRMYIDSTLLAYIPIGCNYVAAKCAFGPKIGKIYAVVLLLSVPLAFVDFGIIASILCVFVSGIAYLLVIIKLITRKYDLCYFGPMVNNDFVNNLKNDKKPEVVNSVETKKEETLDSEEETNTDTNNQVVDLNFGDKGFSYNDSTPDPTVLNDDSYEAPVSGGANTNTESESESTENNNDNNNQDGGSDLTKFFS